MVHVSAVRGVPDKWRRQWKEATVGNKTLILFEMLVAEVLSRLTVRKGQNASRNRMLWLKGLRNTKMIDVDDSIAFEASRIYLRLRDYSLSLVDSFLLAIAKKERARVFTSDHSLRDAAREMKIDVSFLPEGVLEL